MKAGLLPLDVHCYFQGQVYSFLFAVIAWVDSCHPVYLYKNCTTNRENPPVSVSSDAGLDH